MSLCNVTKPLGLLLCAVLVSGLAACADKRIQYLDSDDVEIENVKQVEDGDFLTIYVDLNGDSNDRYHSVYRVEWYDGDDMLLETTSWRPVPVRGKLIEKIVERSTVPGAKTFKILLSNDES